MNKLLLLLFTLLTVITYGQESAVLQGICVDKKNNPIQFVKIRVNEDPRAIETGEDGGYSFEATVGDTINLFFKHPFENLTEKLTYIIKNKGLNRMPKVVFDVETQNIQQVNISKEIEKTFELKAVRPKDWQTAPFLSAEKFLVFTTAASSNNELTSNYNVRGGSYTENLIYINGFQVYRPFLTRAGQQEGMSIINTSLVNTLSFSGGGFDAKYGDKLSSVLDIKYRDADTLRGSFMASMLGIEGSIEQQLGKRKNFSYMFGARYRSNGYFLNSLPTKGSYNPVFYDAQLLTNYYINEKWTWSVFTHFASNNYNFTPQTQKTDFGTANEAYAYTIYFDGKEQTQFRTMFGGTKFSYKPNKKTELDFFASAFNTDEKEYFDVQGQYYINELETDPSKEAFGDSIAVLGIGTFLNHARNRLKGTILNVYHTGTMELFHGFVDDAQIKSKKQDLLWGVNYQHSDFTDVLSEWRLIDSAGYSIPQGSPSQVELLEVIKGNLNLTSEWISGYAQLNQEWKKSKLNVPVTVSANRRDDNKNKYKVTITDTLERSTASWAMTVGTRAGYTNINNEFYVTPRAAVMYYPRAYMLRDSNAVRRNMVIRFQTGLYYQPPFYREFRTMTGNLNLSVQSQKSYHAVLGYDMFFNMWGRDNPFKFTTELYYKYMWDVNPYEVENVRTRYFANNDANAYAYGIDFTMNGEFVKGIDSYFKLGLLSTKEDLLYDQYTEYYNAAGKVIVPGVSTDQVAVDSAIVHPGYIPRPTDQRINIGVLIQDQMPGIEALSVQMGLQFGSALPYGPPDGNRYKDTLRMKSYFRVDIGTSYDFLYKKKAKKTFWNKNFTDAILSFEVYNLLGINNVLSKQWIQGVDGTQYSVPNYLTQRRFNLKLIVRF